MFWARRCSPGTDQGRRILELLILAVLLIAALAGLAALRRPVRRAAPSARKETAPAPPLPSPPDEVPYQRKWSLLSQAERAFYEALCAAAGKDLLVFAKVRLLDVLWVPKTVRDRQSHLNRVMSKHVDFVLCDRHTVAPVLVVELDDASHELPGRAERDAFVDAVLCSTGLPILRALARRSYAPEDLAALIQREIRGARSEARKQE